MNFRRFIFACIALLSFSGAKNLDGVFDAGWTTAYQSQDSITHMHERLHALGMNEIVLQYAAVEATHLYYPSELDFLQNTEYRNDQLFPKSIAAAKSAGTKLWLGLYYDGTNWYSPPTVAQLDTLAARNLRVIDELFSLYGNETVIEGVYIPQEIARYYWDGFRSDATVENLAEHFLTPVAEAAKSKGWKVMAAPFFNQNLETPLVLENFFKKLFVAGFSPSVIAVQDGVGANDNGKFHADTANVASFERAMKNACDAFGIEFWVDAELFRGEDNHALSDEKRISLQIDSARAAGAAKVIGYDLAVLGNAGLDSLESWNAASAKILPKRNPKIRSKSGEIFYYKLNGAHVRKQDFPR